MLKLCFIIQDQSTLPTTAVINSFSNTDNLTMQTCSSTAKRLKQSLYSAPASKHLKKAANLAKTWALANNSNISEEETWLAFDVDVTVNTAEATKKQGARGLTPIITVKLPVLDMLADL
jgi:hypothetical protein